MTLYNWSVEWWGFSTRRVLDTHEHNMDSTAAMRGMHVHLNGRVYNERESRERDDTAASGMGVSVWTTIIRRRT